MLQIDRCINFGEKLLLRGRKLKGKNNRNSFLGVSKTWFSVPTGGKLRTSSIGGDRNINGMSLYMYV